MNILRRIAVAFVLVLALPFFTVASGIRVQPVQFAKGKSSAAIKGTIKGDQTMDYTLRARAGQTLHVALQTTNGANSFHFLPPRSEAAIAMGETLGNTWSGPLPADGEYRIRVFLLRSAASRKETAKFTLTVAITGQVDAKVPGTPYHATGTVPCSVGTDPKGSSNCSFGVIRTGPGKAEVYLAQAGFDLTLHKEGLRILHFTGDSVTSPDAVAKVKFSKHEDNWSISADDFFFYSIPESVISGG